MGGIAKTEQHGGDGLGLDKVAESFGLVIAYLCPGFLMLLALSESDSAGPTVKGWLGQAASFGGFLLIAVSAAGLGVFLWGCAAQLFHELLQRKLVLVPPSDEYLESLRRDAATETAYRDIREQHFRYHQFYASMFIAAPLMYGLWLLKHHARGDVRVAAALLTALVVIEVVLFRNAVTQLSRYRRRRTDLLKVPQSGGDYTHPKPDDAPFREAPERIERQVPERRENPRPDDRPQPSRPDNDD